MKPYTANKNGLQAEFCPIDIADRMRQLSVERQGRRVVSSTVQRRSSNAAVAVSLRNAADGTTPQPRRSPLLPRRSLPRKAHEQEEPAPPEPPQPQSPPSKPPPDKVIARVTAFNIRQQLRPGGKGEDDRYEPYVMYTVHVERKNTCATIYRRYNDFELMHDQLPPEIKSCTQFPARRFWARISGSRFSNKSLESRREALSVYLQTLCELAAEVPIVGIFLSDTWLRIRKPAHINAPSGTYVVARKQRTSVTAEPEHNKGGSNNSSTALAAAQSSRKALRSLLSKRNRLKFYVAAAGHPRMAAIKAESVSARTGALGNVRDTHIGKGTPPAVVLAALPHAPIIPN